MRVYGIRDGQLGSNKEDRTLKIKGDSQPVNRGDDIKGVCQPVDKRIGHYKQDSQPVYRGQDIKRDSVNRGQDIKGDIQPIDKRLGH